MHHYSGVCTPQQPCRAHKHCDYCAALRQRKIAELASMRASGHPITYAVITGLSPATIAAARGSRLGAGGLWTVEIGEKMHGLHLNLLIDAQRNLFADEIAAAIAIPHTQTWAATIPQADLRNVAAYISKRSGMPNYSEYSGKLYGTWGAWRTAAHHARHQEWAPVVSGAAHEAQLAGLGIPASEKQPSGVGRQDPCQVVTRPELNLSSERPLTRAEYREIAARNMPHLREFLGKN